MPGFSTTGGGSKVLLAVAATVTPEAFTPLMMAVPPALELFLLILMLKN
ncbi:hypothetical protein IMZ38_07285 [Thermosphaera chiliense]|uniref:Uncharacterized protein n=1 Tax=Thermosphaera chiliense TaxID=3402707 RepID=A0A7M1UTB9_9CREN|nr:hypothetical protein [Thermosphaera aggregans]QOR94392.1 hypothetical protein IMZ38_07285 [Thermosphaera aggregans]